MKKVFYSLLLFFFSISVNAQQHLRISSISGIPADSVFEVNTYDSISITVVNDDSSAFSDSLFILIKADSIQTTDTLIYKTSVSIPAGDSIVLQRSGYVFSTLYYDDGDNIVVVWPVSIQVPITYDSLTFHFYFVSLITTTESLPSDRLFIFPNPTTRYVSFMGLERIAIKQVRIYDISGKEVYSNTSFQRYISTEKWKSGLYLIKIEKSDGTFQVIKLLKD